MTDCPKAAKPTLDLLVPWELPLDQPLSGRDRERVAQALNGLLQAWQEPVVARALQRVDEALADVGEIDVQMATPSTTSTALRTAEVADYDRYFDLQHVHTTSDALCVVKGLMVTYQQFLTLCDQLPNLCSAHVEQQRQGFKTYIVLLSRVFDIQLPLTERNEP